jgi:uncharacterized protein YndB with AHSA1/START domain
MADSIEPVRKVIEVRCDAGEAFRVMTEEIGEWWPLATHSVAQERAEGCFIEPRIGGRIYETGPEGSSHLWGGVGVWEPPGRLVFSWHPGREASSAQEVELRFRGHGGGARVELEHRRWEVLGPGAAEVRARYESGWEMVLARLVAHCERDRLDGGGEKR